LPEEFLYGGSAHGFQNPKMIRHGSGEPAAPSSSLT
jgi:hypothetical protein